MKKQILGLDLGSNSLGWALLEEQNNKPTEIIDLGVRIFTKAVEEKVPTPKNQKRRDMRLGRRVIQRRAARKQKMLNYLISLDLLPSSLSSRFNTEKQLNELGDPYQLRVKALDEQLTPHELGRILLHLVARRGFLSSKKQISGDLIDDPDTLEYLQSLDKKSSKDKEEGQFKVDIAEVYQAIKKNNCRTLGEFLHQLDTGFVKRNRNHDGGHLRTDRAMYQQELTLIWQQQEQYFNLPSDFIEQIEKIIFYQRPLKLKDDRIGKCSLELKNNRASTARLEVQQFRYLQDINNLQYFERHSEQWLSLAQTQKDKLKNYFEHHPKITITALKNELGLDKPTKINLETKNLKGNITACEIRAIIGKQWDELPYENENNLKDKTQKTLLEDLLSIKKKSALKARLITHWDFDTKAAVKLCLLEFEPGYSNHSLKAIGKILLGLKEGLRYDEARIKAGYGYEIDAIEPQDKLPAPQLTSNPIVNKGLHELKRVVNAIIKQHGKPDIIRIEMARDLEMNTKRYKENEIRQNKNKKANEQAQAVFASLNLGKKYASHDDKIKYRLWSDQDERCAYSNKTIALEQIFTSETEVDHILPFKKSLDDSYLNKVICFTKENHTKSDKTPIDAWGGDNDKWHQITQAISSWDKSLQSKVKRFYTTEADLQKRDFISSQLNDTRYISKLAQTYLGQLGCDISITKGGVVAKIRHQWGFNSLLGERNKKERTDHRHHAIDAVVIGVTSRRLYQKAVNQIKQNKLNIEPPYSHIRDELNEKLNHTLISHTPQKKLSGALHEETGAGYIAKHGGLVYRKTLSGDFSIKDADKIVDKEVKIAVLEHISNYKDTKTAFSAAALKDLKLGKHPIKRVRILQSKVATTKNKTGIDTLRQTKFGVKDQQGNIFKWMSYGNNHHVEIIQHKQTEKIKGEFVTMMEAQRRAMTGTNHSKKHHIPPENIIKTNHGEDWQFLMVLHINDLVSVENNQGGRTFYRVQKLESSGGLTLRLNTASTLNNKEEEIRTSISNLFTMDVKKHRINAIGYFLDD